MNAVAQRAVIAAVQVLGLAVWFSMSAVVPSLRTEWGLGSTGAVWLTASVQLGFVTGALTSAALTLADRLPPQRLLAIGSALASACTVLLAVTVDQAATAFPLRFLTGMCLAAVYPVGMKLMASWSGRAERGRNMGVLIGALTLGSTLPHLIAGLGSLPWRGVLLAAAAAGALASVVASAFLRVGPHAAPAAPAGNPRYALTMFTERRPRLANLGYFGHMWELYALWTWIPAYLSATAGAGRLPGSVGTAVFLTMGIGGVVGCLLGGWGADRFGRPSAAMAALLVSGLCCLLSPLIVDASPELLFAFCAVWGAAVIADSGVFSTSLSEAVDPRYVGTALTAQTAIGFALTVVSIQLTPLLADAFGWRYALLLLAPGPLAGAVAMRALKGAEPLRFGGAVGEQRA
ncbi:MFS transporter [Streptomyces luteolus]|uniref:MFS transporter n=1 Tax=Streptomyces luteolus TaxID=3043615 RepID=A0ABT6SQA1_9ACTN|nr:MFS transporter [Streptomyces sp. B-S-A12]MDI3417793.1 MFS transporter [Streptomyces sp. B-S-A12]